MKIRTVLVMLLILALILPLSYSFYSTQSFSFTYQTGSTPSVVVVLKESYVLARVQITVDPQVGVEVQLQNGTYVTLNPSATVQFENGTTRTLTSQETFSFVLPNTETFAWENVGTTGPSGSNLDSGNPIVSGLLTGNDTQSLGFWQRTAGIDTFYVQVTGNAQVNVIALGASI
jgi:hypothetical protein